MINQTDLKYFLELSKSLHVSRAAERLGVTQPALSHCLKRIEGETKTQLFVRSKKGLSLTDAGRRLAERASELIQKWDEVLLSAQNEVLKVAGQIRFGCHSAVAHLDLIIKEISKDRVTLWKSRNCLNTDVLIVEPSLLQTQDLLRKFQKKNIYFSRVVESSSLEVISQLVISGVGCGILPERVIKAFGGQQIQSVKDAPEFHDRMCLVYKAEFRKSMRGQALIEAVSKKLS